ncbi:hypothetical protein QTP86_025547 [Hemibagrus guttatus]|nr:hypothetical protein QTP86_025547 [Hemibagrus guttatus]
MQQACMLSVSAGVARFQLGNVVGHENIVSASRMNSAIVVFLNDVEKVRKLTQNGIVGNNETILVSPLSSPVKKVMLCPSFYF